MYGAALPPELSKYAFQPSGPFQTCEMGRRNPATRKGSEDRFPRSDVTHEVARGGGGDEKGAVPRASVPLGQVHGTPGVHFRGQEGA